MRLEQTFRWFGKDDVVSLKDIKQTGATGIVTALHHVPPGEVWTVDEILAVKQDVESHGLTWSTVESVAVHEDIKTRSGNYQTYLNNYKRSLLNLGACGIHTVCYNFMPVLDWTRTHLDFTIDDGSYALRFDMLAFIAFDVFILKRTDAENDYTAQQLEDAKVYVSQLDENAKKAIQKTILMGLPGTVEDLDLQDFSLALKAYDGIDRNKLKENYFAFLKEIIPVAEQAKVNMAVHPDDPPISIFGLPRIVNCEEDLSELLQAVESPCNGLTFCTGSLGSSAKNDVVAMVKKFSPYIHFVHLRNVCKEENGSFYESDHLSGDVEMYEVMKILLEELNDRSSSGKGNQVLPIRPDHGHQMLDDLNKSTYPGYSAIGRLRGLAELRGLEVGITKSLFQ